MTRDEVCARIRALRAVLASDGVASISLFGSAARDELRPDSDIDILVRFAGTPTFDAFMTIKERLEGSLGRRVDLVTEPALKPMLREHVLREAVLVA
jgi:predicted nucleotidyltransferase